MLLDKKYYSTRETAKILGVANSTIQLWETNGLLKAKKTAGGHRRILAESIDSMLKEQSEGITKDKIESKPNIEKNNKEQLSIVIVEDNLKLQKLYRKQFCAIEPAVHLEIASDGYEGLIKIGKYHPDIIITDLMMPNMDGFQMINALNKVENFKRPLIFAVSALNDKEVEKKGGLPSNVKLITKPILLDDLKMMVFSHV